MLNEMLQFVLRQHVPQDHVQSRRQGGQNVDYVGTQYVIDRLNEIFGYEKWSFTIVSQSWHDEGEVGKKGGHGVNRVVSAEAHVRLRVEFEDGSVVEREDVGLGDAVNPTIYGARMQALKSAVSDGLKRAARTLGPQFGLGLYGRLGVPVGESGTPEHHVFSAKLKRALPAEVYQQLESVAGDGLSRLKASKIYNWLKATEKSADDIPAEIDSFLTTYGEG